MPNLAYLDDRPVFELEKVAVKAWAKGGVEAEREARKAFQTNKIEKDRQSMRSFRRWKDERRAARQAEIEKCKREGRAVPEPKKYVSYREMDDSEMDEADRMRAALAKAERNVGTHDIKALGREYWKNEGVPVFDENGNPVEETTETTVSEPVVSKESAPPAPSTKTIPNPPIPASVPARVEPPAKTNVSKDSANETSETDESAETERQNRVAA